MLVVTRLVGSCGVDYMQLGASLLHIASLCGPVKRSKEDRFRQQSRGNYAAQWKETDRRSAFDIKSWPAVGRNEEKRYSMYSTVRGLQRLGPQENTAEAAETTPSAASNVHMSTTEKASPHVAESPKGDLTLLVGTLPMVGKGCSSFLRRECRRCRMQCCQFLGPTACRQLLHG